MSGLGRAMVAHHAVLVVDVLGTSEFDPVSVPEKADDKAPSVVRNLMA